MKLRIFLAALAVLLHVTATGATESDYLSIMASQSEIKAIAVVHSVQRMSRNSDGTFMRVTFKRVHAVTPFTPNKFVGGCKTMESSWQKRDPGTVYFKPRKGERVFVTITTNGGAIYQAHAPARGRHPRRTAPHSLPQGAGQRDSDERLGYRPGILFLYISGKVYQGPPHLSVTGRRIF